MPDSSPLRRLVAFARRTEKPWSTLLIVAAGIALTYASPVLSRFRPVTRAAAASAMRSIRALSPTIQVVQWQGDTEPVRPTVTAQLAATRLADGSTGVAHAGLRLAAVLGSGPSGGSAAQTAEPRPRGRVQLPGREIEDAGGSSLASFYAALGRTRRGLPGAVTRIVHFGDSPVTGDLISSGARFRLQAKYGDAGHGFLFVARPWEWYNHRGVELSSSGWRMESPLFRSGNDGFYGLGGVCFVGAGPGSRCQVGTVAKGPGSAVGRFDIFFESKPAGGTLLASVDDQSPEEIQTAGTERRLAVHSIEVPDGPHTLELVAMGNGEAVVFGVALERAGPGVVYDSLGTNGGTVHFLTLIDEACWRDSLAARKPDLVILNYGTNESGYGFFKLDAYTADIKKVIARIRAAVPTASILVMAPMDRGTTDESGELVTMPTIPRIVATQRAVAAAAGVAFYDTFAAMGGEGTMARWYRANTHLVTGDLTHPTGVGADLVSGLLVDALEAGFAAFEATQGNGAPTSPQQQQEPCIPDPQ